MIRRPRADEGFTMVEVLVAIAVVSVVMLSLASYFVASLRIDNEQGDRQLAVQAADDAMERARALQVGALLTGRDYASSLAQWQSPVAGVSSLLATTAMTMAYDKDAAAGAGASAVLPTSSNPLWLNGVKYLQYWYIGSCQRGSTAAAGCLTSALTSKFSSYYNIIVAVTWPGRTCDDNVCSFVTSTLISSTTADPVFNTNTGASPLVISANPGTQTNDVSLPVSLGISSSGGTAPITWSATSLPTGLSIVSSTGVISGTPTATGTFTPVVTVSDAYSQQDFITFSWVIKALPVMTAPGTVSSQGGSAYTKTFAVTGGTSPYKWSTGTSLWGSTGLPPGLTLDTTAGTVSGTPTTAGSNAVTLTVTDTFGQASSQTFTWTVPALAVSSFTVPTSKTGTAISSVTLAATGGILPYASWSATNLPTGLTLNSSTGVISGTPTLKGTYSTVVTVTDSSAVTATRTTSWTVS